MNWREHDWAEHAHDWREHEGEQNRWREHVLERFDHLRQLDNPELAADPRIDFAIRLIVSAHAGDAEAQARLDELAGDPTWGPVVAKLEERLQWHPDWQTFVAYANHPPFAPPPTEGIPIAPIPAPAVPLLAPLAMATHVPGPPGARAIPAPAVPLPPGMPPAPALRPLGPPSPSTALVPVRPAPAPVAPVIAAPPPPSAPRAVPMTPPVPAAPRAAAGWAYHPLWWHHARQAARARSAGGIGDEKEAEDRVGGWYPHGYGHRPWWGPLGPGADRILEMRDRIDRLNPPPPWDTEPERTYVPGHPWPWGTPGI
jgi:hypothetical protein